MNKDTKFLANKTKKLKSAYLAVDFVPNLVIGDSNGKRRKFFKILWDYIPYSDPEVLVWAGKRIADKAKKKGAEVILGMELSGVHYAAVASTYSKLPFGLIRKSPKEYGLRRDIEGEFGKKKRALVVDNFVFTGGTLVRAAEKLKKEDIKAVGFISVDNFDTLPKASGFDDLPFFSLVANSEKIDLLLEMDYFPSKLKPFIKKYVNIPELFFKPSELHEEYVKAFSKLASSKIIVRDKKRQILR